MSWKLMASGPASVKLRLSYLYLVFHKLLRCIRFPRTLLQPSDYNTRTFAHRAFACGSMVLCR
jgi:hypothetical protein